LFAEQISKQIPEVEMDLKIDELRFAAKYYLSKCPRAVERALALISLSKRTKSIRSLTTLDYERVAGEFGITARTLFRWKGIWDESGVKGLRPRTSSGRKRRAVSGFIAKKIMEYRRNYNWGAEVIQAHLKLDYDQIISEDRIHRFLLRKGLIEAKKRKKLKNRHRKVVRVNDPGAHTQNDVKHLPRILQSKEKCYVYNLVDHASKWEFKHAYLSYGPTETKDFVERVLKNCPFEITRWQTDNGIEFTYKYVSLVDKPKKHALDKICKKNNIRHVLIPPGEKELQGLVERNHRMDDEELYHRIRPRNIAEFNRYLEAHYKWKNSSRRRKSLDWKTPNEWLNNYDKKLLSGIVRHKDPVKSVVPAPDEGLEPQRSWERGLNEVWGHMARQTKPEATKLTGPGQTRQKFLDSTKQTGEVLRSVSGTKKAA
jgi:transposase